MAADNTMRVLVDLNVILDVLTLREPYHKTSRQVWAAVEAGRVQGLIAAHSVTTLFYLLTRHTSSAQARMTLIDLLQVFSVASVDQAAIQTAIIFAWPDFEDAVQMTAAMQAGATYVVTRNPDDFKNGPLAALTPPSFLALLDAD
jgi:predicted nucleic acid-binding protein